MPCNASLSNARIRCSLLLVGSLVALAGHRDARADSGANDPLLPEVRFTGPLVTPSPLLPKGLVNVQPYLIYSSNRGSFDGEGYRRSAGPRDTWQAIVPVTYGAHERITLGATFRAFHRGGNAESDGSELGDTTLVARFLLTSPDSSNRPRLSVGLSQNVDTGRHDRLDHQDALSTGSGAPTTSLSLVGQSYFLPNRTLRGRFHLAWRLPHDDIAIEGHSTYGTQAGFHGRVDLGPASSASVGVEYSLSPNWALALDAAHEREGSARIRGTAVNGALQVPVDARTGDSWRFSLAPAVEYHWSATKGLIAGIFVSLDGRNAVRSTTPQVAYNYVF